MGGEGLQGGSWVSVPLESQQDFSLNPSEAGFAGKVPMGEFLAVTLELSL